MSQTVVAYNVASALPQTPHAHDNAEFEVDVIFIFPRSLSIFFLFFEMFQIKMINLSYTFHGLVLILVSVSHVLNAAPLGFYKLLFAVP